MNTPLQEWLNALSPTRADNYADWLAVGMALHAAGGTCADWDAWSRQSEKYRPGICEAKWRTFGRYTGTPVSAGSLCQMAKEDGFIPHEPLDWDSPIGGSLPEPAANRDLIRYLRAVFQPGETLNYVVQSFVREGKYLPHGKGVCRLVETLVRDLEKYSDLGYALGDWNAAAGAWIRCNPIKGEGCHNADVVSFRHALVESDKLPKPEQLAKIKTLNLPCAAIVDSGGKSVHAIVKIEAGTDEPLYRERVGELHAFLEAHGFPVDKACKNPSRLSRMPGILRNGVAQKLIAVNVGAPSWDVWQAQRAEIDLELEEVSIAEMLNAPSNDMSDALLGNRFLCRAGSWLIVAQSGIGKSVLAMQLAMHFCVGRSLWGISPREPRKTVLIQAENNRLDLVEPSQSIATKMCFSPEERALLERNFVIVSEDKSSGLKFIGVLEKICKRHKPDIVMIDPLLSYIGGEISKQEVCSLFLRNQINPLIHKHNIGLIIMHHTGKPAREKPVQTVADLAYLGVGSSELTNWARAVSVIVQNSEDNAVYELTHAKRGKRAGGPLKTYLRHAAEPCLYWEEADRPAETAKGEVFRKSKYDNYGFETMPPLKHDKKPESSQVIRFIAQKLAEHGDPASTKDAVRAFETIRKLSRPLIVYAAPFWQGCLHMPSIANETEVRHA